jgi:hypothetical protein
MPKIEWGRLIVNCLFMGGLSAGIYFVSTLATYLQDWRIGTPVTVTSVPIIFRRGTPVSVTVAVTIGEMGLTYS